MKKMKKLLALMLAMILCFGLCACGGSEEEEDENLGGTTEISLWFSYGSLSQAYLDEIVDEFNLSQDEYFVKVQNAGSVSEVRTKLDSTLNKEDYPDLLCGTTVATAYYEAADYIKNVQDFVDKEETDWTTGIFENVRAVYSDSEGNLLGYPLGVSCSGYWVNVDAVTAAGYTLEDLTSFEKIIEVATAIVDKGICEYGVSYMGSDGGMELVDMLTIQGVDYVDNNNGYDGKPSKSLLMKGETYEAYKKAAGLFAKSFETGVAMPYTTVVSTSAFPKYNDGQLAMLYATNSWGHYVFDAEPEFEYAFIPSVGVDENAKYKGQAICEGSGLYMCNTENEKKMQGAYEFIKFVAQPEMQSIYCQGLGYVPYTDEAVAQEDYQEWMQEYLPSAQGIIDKLKSSSSELRTPYVEFFDEMQTVTKTLNSYISNDPTGDIEDYMKKAADEFEEGIEIWLERQ